MTKTAFIAIVGRPNVGKSTLMNRLLGEKVAIVSPRPQTTRTRIAGILTRGEDQFVFLDTPGVHRAKTRLGDRMMRSVRSTFGASDAILLLADAGYDPGEIEKGIIGRIVRDELPAMLVLNKIDLINRERLARTIQAYADLCSFDAVVPTCAETGKNVDEVLEEASRYLSEGDWMFDADALTDQPERQIASEIIREKILRTLSDEIPHGTAVVVEEFTEEETLLRIRAEIFVEKPSHKGILIGKNGETLKRIATFAREDMETFFGQKVYLNLWVKVKENWRDSETSLNLLGFRNKDAD